MQTPFNVLWASIWWLSKRRHDLLLREFWNLENSWNEVNRTYLKSIWEKQQHIDLFFESKKKASLSEQLNLLEKHKTKLIYLFDEDYPFNLKQIPDPPIYLYVRWDLKKQDSTSLSWVWSRNITQYGIKSVNTIIPPLCNFFSIVSWLAYWIDTLVHKVTLNSKWRTIAVLANWLDTIYPLDNTHLAQEIEKSWAIISEYPFNTKPERYNFPRRNRIIAWFSLWTIIFEARESSWSLITAKLALDYDREVFALPWNIFSTESMWSNNLIKKAEAKAIINSNDILNEFNISSKPAPQQIELQLNPESQIILWVLDNYWKDLNQISEQTGLPVDKINALLTFLELKWVANNIWMWIWTK